MKSINDFKIIDGVATLEGVMLASEANVVKEFLINNKNVELVTVSTNDKRYFKLEGDRLVSANERVFLNPYFISPVVVEAETPTIQIETTVNGECEPCDCCERLNELEKRIIDIENKLL